MDLELKGKRALVFGASSGIGLGIAESFSAESMTLALCSREGEKLRSLESKFKGASIISGKSIPDGRLGKPPELGQLATFLCSKHADYITGQAIACDGGRQKSL